MNKERNFGFLLKETSSCYVLRFEKRAALIGLTLAQCKVLTCLVRNEGINQTKLSEITALEPMAIVRILDAMERENLLERRMDSEDRRVKKLYLTEKASTVLEEIWRIADRTRSEVFQGFSDEQKNMFILMLEHMHQNLLSMEKQPLD